MANRGTQHCFETDGEGEVSYDAQLLLVGNVREAGGGKVFVAGDELLVVRTAESATARGREAVETLQPGNPCKNHMPSSGVIDRSCVTSAHETLPWGSHYRNLVTASGHAWVTFALEHDPQVREAATRAQAAAADRDDDDSDADDNIPVLDAYSDGSVLAKGVGAQRQRSCGYSERTCLRLFGWRRWTLLCYQCGRPKRSDLLFLYLLQDGQSGQAW